jgi:hypothetical protein
MSMNKEVNPSQALALTAAFLVLLGLLFWAGARFRSMSSGAVAPVEQKPVAEEVVASPRETPSATAARPMSGEAARRQEALENLKFGVQHSQ